MVEERDKGITPNRRTQCVGTHSSAVGYRTSTRDECPHGMDRMVGGGDQTGNEIRLSGTESRRSDRTAPQITGHRVAAQRRVSVI